MAWDHVVRSIPKPTAGWLAGFFEVSLWGRGSAASRRIGLEVHLFRLTPVVHRAGFIVFDRPTSASAVTWVFLN